MDERRLTHNRPSQPQLFDQHRLSYGRIGKMVLKISWSDKEKLTMNEREDVDILEPDAVGSHVRTLHQ